MKANPRLRTLRTLKLLVVSGILVAAVCMSGDAEGAPRFGTESPRRVEPAVEQFQGPVATAKRTAPRLRLDISVVEYPADKGSNIFRLIGLADAPRGSFIDLARPAPHSGPLPEKPPIVTRLNEPDTTLTWILTKDLDEFILDKLKQSSDAQVIGGPRIVTVPGERTKVEFEYPGQIVRHLDASQDQSYAELDAFPTLYVEPRVKPDGYTIDLKTTQAIRDLVGYELGGSALAWDYVESIGANPSPQEPRTTPHDTTSPKPIYHLREAKSDAVLRGGQTLVVSGLTASEVSNTSASNKSRLPLLGDLPMAGKFFRTRTIPPEKKKVLVFITPTLLDEEGKPIQPEDFQAK